MGVEARVQAVRRIAAPTRPSLPAQLRLPRSVSIWLYNVALLGGAVALWEEVLSHLRPVSAVATGVPWWVLALVFFLAEASAIHVRFHREAHTISLSEVGLVLGLYLVSPGGLLLAQILGSAAAFAVIRRQRAAKFVFNLAQLVLTTSVAVLIFRTATGLAHPFDPVGWAAAIVACIAASLLGILLVTGAIAIAEGKLSVRRSAVGVAVLVPLCITNLTLVGIELAHSDGRSVALLMLPVVIGLVAFRSLGQQARRHEHLAFLYESMKATQEAPEFSLAVGQLLVTVRQLVRADYAEIFLFPIAMENGLRSRLGAQGEMTSHPDVVGPADQGALLALRTAGTSVLLPSTRPPHLLDGYLAERRLPDAIIATLDGEQGPFGLLVVGDRVGDVDTFDWDDKRLLETFVGHASVMLEKGRLERSLAEVTDLKERLRHQAFHDSLTGLPNRALLTERVEAAISRGADSKAAVLFLDLDDFKAVNDTLGHAVGDEVLVEVARRVERSVRPGDTAARLGGDEFAVLLEQADQADSEVVARSLLEAMQQPFDLEGRETVIHASVGIALAGSARSADELLSNADVAMYSAKSSGKHRYCGYAPLMHAQVRRRHEFALALQGALGRGEIELVYEPIVDLRDGRIVAVEALARWHSQSRGIVGPAEFIPVAEEIGLMVPIGRAILRQACLAARSWQSTGRGAAGIVVAVNLSPSELANEHLADDVARALFESRLRPESLMLEITESDVMSNIDFAQQRMAELRALGVKLVLDDFGTGHSSLERLDTFPVDSVKIAKPFVDRLLESSATPFIDAFVRLARSLELQCIAEGIEHDEQVPRLRERGCAYGQGHHFARPMTTEQLHRYLRAAPERLVSAG